MNSTDKSLIEKSIVFIGFMGAGKTTIGKLVANKLSREFIDIDKEIETEYNMTTSAFFKTYGEKAFRQKEKSLISQFSTQPDKIISVGGGAFLQEEVQQNCLSNCMVIFLDVTWDSWKKRLHLLMDSRPVLQGKSEEEIKELFYNRQSIYSKHHLKVQIDTLDSEEAADYIVGLLQSADVY